MKLFNSENNDVINNCQWYFDFELSSEMLINKVPNSRGNLLTIKICIVTLVFVRSSCNLVKLYFVHICNVLVYLFLFN